MCTYICDPTAGIQTSSSNTQYSEQFVIMFTLVMTQLKQVQYVDSDILLIWVTLTS